MDDVELQPGETSVETGIEPGEAPPKRFVSRKGDGTEAKYVELFVFGVIGDPGGDNCYLPCVPVKPVGVVAGD